MLRKIFDSLKGVVARLVNTPRLENAENLVQELQNRVLDMQSDVGKLTQQVAIKNGSVLELQAQLDTVQQSVDHLDQSKSSEDLEKKFRKLNELCGALEKRLEDIENSHQAADVLAASLWTEVPDAAGGAAGGAAGPPAGLPAGGARRWGSAETKAYDDDDDGAPAGAPVSEQQPALPRSPARSPFREWVNLSGTPLQDERMEEVDEVFVRRSARFHPYGR